MTGDHPEIDTAQTPKHLAGRAFDTCKTFTDIIPNKIVELIDSLTMRTFLLVQLLLCETKFAQ